MREIAMVSVALSLVLITYLIVELIREYLDRYRILSARVELLIDIVKKQSDQIKVMSFCISDLRGSVKKSADDSNETLVQLIEVVTDEKKD